MSAQVLKAILILLLGAHVPLMSRATETPSILKLGDGPSALRTDVADRSLGLAESDKVVVVVAYGVGCPVMRQNIPAFLALEREMGPRVRFIYVDGNPQDTEKKIREEAKAYGLEGRIGLDHDQKWLRAFGLGTVGEAVVIDKQKDGNFKVMFRGGISDRVNFDRALPKPRKEYLKIALKEVADGKPVSRSTAPTFGCSITFK